MNAMFFDLDCDEHPLNGSAVASAEAVRSLFEGLNGRRAFMFQLQLEDGSTLDIGVADCIGCVQHTPRDGMTSSRMATTPTSPPLGGGDTEFSVGGTATPIDNRYCVPLSLVVQIAIQMIVGDGTIAEIVWEDLATGCSGIMTDNNPGIDAQDDVTTASERQKTIREFCSQMSISLVITLAAICVPIALSLSLPLEWVIGERLTSLATAFGMGSIVAITAAFGIYRKAPTYFASLSADCKSGSCERLSICAHRAVAFETSVTAPAIAIGCGDRTLIVFGGWWTNRSRRPDITWKSVEPHPEFPAKRFVIRRLTRTGRVLSVQIEGDRLPVERWIDPQTMNLPTLNADFPLSVDVVLLERPLDSLIGYNPNWN